MEAHRNPVVSLGWSVQLLACSLEMELSVAIDSLALVSTLRAAGAARGHGTHFVLPLVGCLPPCFRVLH